MIAVVRITGQVGLNKEVRETLDRLKLKKKYSCVVFKKPTEVDKGMIKAVKNFVAYGELGEEDYKKLVDARGKKGAGFFRLHPPRKGIDSKKGFGVGKGVLGNHGDKINELIGRML